MADTIVLVSASDATRSAARALLDRADRVILTTATGAEAVRLLARHPAAVVFADATVDGPGRQALFTALAELDPPAQLLPLVPPVTDGLALAAMVELAVDARAEVTRLRMVDRLKSEMLASVSHELRSPLNVIVGYVELLREGAFGACSTEAVAAFEKVGGNAVHVLELIEEFLDLSRSETNGAGAPERIALTPFLRELAESFTVLVRTKPVVFRAKVPDGLPCVLAERAKLRVVVQNLLSNAEKFTATGTIELSAGPESVERVAIRVRDTGPGIPPEQQEAIFGLFHQLGEEPARRRGIGLGLALARRFARLMAGDVSVESRVGCGSTFTVVLPVATSRPGSTPSPN